MTDVNISMALDRVRATRGKIPTSSPISAMSSDDGVYVPIGAHAVTAGGAPRAFMVKLVVNTDKAGAGEPAWMEGFGKLRRLRKETQRIQARVDERFEVTEPEDPA